MVRYSIKPRTRKYVKRNGFLSFAKNLSNKYEKKLLDTAKITVLDVAKTTSKKVVYKTAKATGDLIGNRIAEKM